ncbi:murein hydrolase activator EnvC family protein [Campylobacter upsaliensis]|uniref:murein hydrolase activator EnvC family protein n=1 Tax=Campylobacter upsaliensis TaxID=28080 RepID=UPI001E085878|nr:M23 family metallopeptidase [Campylobacter upsaliensis]EHE0558855.1 peptidoglycan DD-metalloendopeptidase family protein [Campylobacter upsaliensis]MCR2098565.1 peptidoglycan DD-metalloendopeptidase family protein [Campylobacter upsaliensis]MCR2113844.1 peptidoglycan DD-metalloendopeptidase family protein [Campylobacter upsaliensis]MCR2120876.1 peptidoglycan DD-metalloendopeptidase family protein [Campylobacter upsaliensis]MCR2123691.1 peptidoglycan DD-metalloendopeptidase family protein [C
MRKLFLFSLFSLLLFANGIAEKTKDLKENERIQQQLSKKLEDLAQDILSGEKNLKNLSEQINTLSSQTSKLEANIKVQNKELNTLNNQNKELLRIKSLMESKLISLMAKDFAYDLPIPEGYIEGEESFMAFELLGSLDKVLSEEISKLSKDYEGVNLLIENKQKQIEQIRLNLKNYNEQLKELQSLKNRQIKEINQQKTDRQIYAKKLDNLKAQQEELRATLDELKIIDKKEQVKKQKEETSKLTNNNQKIRQIGSSYQGSSVKRYTGKKTIAPLDSFTIKQKFGNYVDPIYNIKIFNENVVLRSKKADATVKSVLDGRVVFAKNTTMLQRVVIIEHNDGIHTIYAHLDKIAPNIKVGKRVKKGAVVGRIKDDLTFEVTQKNFHINPLELISLN